MSELLRFKFGQKYVVFDAETVCLNLASPRIQGIHQWGWLVAQKNKQLDILETHEDTPYFKDLISKMREWGRQAAIITGFSESAYLSKATDPAPILDNFNKFLLDPKVISITANGQNFDAYLYKIYNTLLKRKTDFSWIPNHYDIQIIHKAKVLEWAFPKMGTPEWVSFCYKLSIRKDKGLKTSLAYLCKEYEIPYQAERHHKEASYDSELTLAIFEKQIGQLDISI